MTTTVRLDSPWQRARGVIGRYPAPDERFVFEYDTVAPRSIHMVGVTRPLRVEWYVGDEKVFETVLQPWVGHGRAPADRVIESRP